MSASTGGMNFNGRVTLSKSEMKRRSQELYKHSFADLEDGTIYRDPMGWKTSGPAGTNGIELQKARWDQLQREPVMPDGSSVVEKWNELQRKGFSAAETTRTIQKNLDTGDWTLPIDVLPEVFTVNPERLPMADMMSRVSTSTTEVVPTPLTDHPKFEFGLETTDNTEGSYAYKEPDYDGDLSFEVIGMGAATRLEDKIILAENDLRNAESTQQEAFMRGGQQTLERQIILGTDFDSTGFTGFNDLIASGAGDTVTDIGDPDSAAAGDYEEATRDIITAARRAGAQTGNLVVVCDYDWHSNLRKSLVDDTRYEPTDEVFGISQTLEFDGVPVFESNAIPLGSGRADGSTYNQAYTVNMEATYLSVLQEMTMKPLAKVAPQEQTAFDFYGCLTSEENGAHIQAATISPVA